MLLAENGIIPPKEWYHEPKLKNQFGNTVAMLLAWKGIASPPEWRHNPYLANENR